jgi:hypothetical protein
MEARASARHYETVERLRYSYLAGGESSSEERDGSDFGFTRRFLGGDALERLSLVLTFADDDLDHLRMRRWHSATRGGG